MKFTIELEEFWSDEDTGGLDEELKHSIKLGVIREIRSSIKDKVDAEIKIAVQQQITDSMSTEIAMMTREIVTSGTIIEDSRSETRTTVKDAIIKAIEGGRGNWNDPRAELQKYADSHMKKIKEQYDFMYASSVVKKMADLGMLKDDKVAELLESK